MKKQNNYSIEELYLLLQNKQWNKLLQFEKENRKQILKDDQIKNIYENFFFPEYIKYIELLDDKLSSIVEAKQLYKHFIQLYNTSTYHFEDNFIAFTVVFLDMLKDDNLEIAYTYAKKWEELDVAKLIIEEYSKNKVLHSQSDIMHIKKIEDTKKNRSTINLLKSKQEVDFFNAVRSCYMNFFIYPNVALSCIIDFEKIEAELTEQEKAYFFKSIVDCVVFKEENNNYKPCFFFELDSIYHDTEKMKQNDNKKNRIFELSGLKLIRIRPKREEKLNEENFKIAINEAIGNE